MSEPYDLSTDPEPIDELQRELERIARAVSERVEVGRRSRAIRHEQVAAAAEADEERWTLRDPSDRAGSDHAPAHVDHAQRLADRLAAQQLDTELVQSRLLADRSHALPATAVGRPPRLRARARRGTVRRAERRRAVDRHAG